MSFLEKLRTELNTTRTENGDKAYKSTFNGCLDFFALAGAARKTSEQNILRLFYIAYAEEPLTALRLLFYLRDIRGGLGERRSFRIITHALAEEKDENLIENLELFAHYGRWDDLVKLIDTPLDNYVVNIIKTQLNESDEEFPSLLGKWLPSENTSSEETRRLARLVRRGLSLSSRDYRKMLSKLRKKINIVERLISSDKWQSVDYEKVPSKAMMNYRDAFMKHDGSRFQKYLDSVAKGEKEIKAKTLFPYEIYNKLKSSDAVLEEQWKALPDYTQKDQNAIVVADVSGSMIGLPMSVSVSLALYFAERNTGLFKDHFMTFSAEPELVKVQGDTLYRKMETIERSNWGGNTNLAAVFEIILKTAIKNNASQKELPETIYIISDMQFDQCANNSDESTFEMYERKFHENDYKLPHIVFWNVDARANMSVPVMPKNRFVSLVSGLSPTIFKLAVEGKTAEELMREVVESDRYSLVKLVE